jgi:O-antigen/teichoic acid export membrane protein
MISLFSIGVLSQLHVTMDYVVVGTILGVVDVAEFSAAFRILAVLLIFPNLLWSSFYPLLSRMAPEKALWTQCFGIMMKYQWAVAWFFVGLAVWYPGELLNILYGDRYAGSQELLQVLLLSLSASFLSMALLRSFPALGYERQSLRIFTLATGIHIIAAVILTMVHGIIGTGLAFLVTELFLFGAAAFRLWPVVRKGLATGAVLFFGCMAFAFLGSELMQIVAEMNREAGLFLAVILYCVLAVTAGGLSLRQLKELESSDPITESVKS